MVLHAKSSRGCLRRSYSVGHLASRRCRRQRWRLLRSLRSPESSLPSRSTRPSSRGSVSTFQSVSVWSPPSGGGRARIGIVHECHAMTNEDVVLNRDAFADERMARDLAAPPDTRILLNLDEGADLGFVADLAAVKIDELRKFDGLAELYIRPDRAEFVLAHRRTSSPLFWIDASAASSMRTTRSPAWPSLKGVLPFMMQSAK